jgi:hypothetical protein
LKAFETVYKVFPDLEALVAVEIVVAENELDTRLEGFVEGSNSIAGEDENSYRWVLAQFPNQKFNSPS